MAFDPGLAQRIREFLDEREGYVEKKMFGGVCYLVGGNMACGIIGDALIVRVGPHAYESCLTRPHTRVFDFTGKTMKGWVGVSPEGTAEDDALASWIEAGLAYAMSLPMK